MPTPTDECLSQSRRYMVFSGLVNQVEATRRKWFQLTAKASRLLWPTKSSQPYILVSANSHRLLLGQVKVENKSNEITAIGLTPTAWLLLGAYTIDAIGTQTEVLEPNCAGSRLYLEPESEPPHLYAQVKRGLNRPVKKSIEAQLRPTDWSWASSWENRQIWVVPAAVIEDLYQPSLGRTAAKRGGSQSAAALNKTTVVQFYLSSAMRSALVEPFIGMKTNSAGSRITFWRMLPGVSAKGIAWKLFP